MEPQLPPKSLPKDNKSRSFPISVFSRKMPNGETVARDWLVWSETAQSLFCFCCCLFATKSPSSTQSELSHPQLGCNDNWRKLYEKTLGHKKSSAHISNYMKWRDLILSLEMCKEMDSFQRQELFNEKERWREIVKSLLEVTLHLAERNLPFRGSTSAVGDPENGLFLGTLELIGNHDSTITAISSDSRPPKFEMLDINNCFWHSSAVVSSIKYAKFEFTAHQYFRDFT